MLSLTAFGIKVILALLQTWTFELGDATLLPRGLAVTDTFIWTCLSGRGTCCHSCCKAEAGHGGMEGPGQARFEGNEKTLEFWTF